MVVRESSEARARARSPIGGPLNPGGQTARLRLLSEYLMELAQIRDYKKVSNMQRKKLGKNLVKTLSGSYRRVFMEPKQAP
jgi:hypothetical protein